MCNSKDDMDEWKEVKGVICIICIKIIVIMQRNYVKSNNITLK